MATKIQIRRGTATEWSSINPTLSAGEIGFEVNTNKFKIGNGLSNWLALPYAAASESYVNGLVSGLASQNYVNTAIANLGNTIGSYVPLSSVGVSDGLATLDETGNVPLAQLANVPAGGNTGEQIHPFAMIG